MTIDIRVRNRLRPGLPVAKCTIAISMYRNDPRGIEHSETRANGRGEARFDPPGDGHGQLVVYPPSGTRWDKPVGPDTAKTTPRPMHILRSLKAKIEVQGGKITSAKPLGTPGGIIVRGSTVMVGLQPVWMQSPKYKRSSRKGGSLSLIVVHHTGGSKVGTALNTFVPQGRGGIGGIHYLIDRDGQVIKLIHETERAEHAGYARWKGSGEAVNDYSVGIELVHKNWDKVLKDGTPNPLYKLGGIYHRKSNPFSDGQYNTLISLLGRICDAYNTPRHRIVGHGDVNLMMWKGRLRLGAKAACPGLDFDWVELEKAGLGILGPRVKPILTGQHAWFPEMYDKFFARKPSCNIGHGTRGETKAVRELKQDLMGIGYYVDPRSRDRFEMSTHWAVRTFQHHFFSGKTRGPWIGVTDWQTGVEQQYKAYRYWGQVDQLTAAMIKYVALPHLFKAYLSGKSASEIGKVLKHIRSRPSVLWFFGTKEGAQKMGQRLDRVVLKPPSEHKEAAQGVVDGGLAAETPAPAAPSTAQPVRVHPCSQRSRGFYKYGGGRLDKKLRDMKQRGKITISDRDIATLQRIANVEIGGQVRGVWNCDKQILSFGFMQWTVTWGLLQQVIARAPAAFRRYGIELDPGRTFSFKGGRVPAIKGVTDPEKQLRQRDWVARFYRAGLDEDVIAAEVAQAKAKLKTVDARIKRVLGPQVWNLYLSGDRRDAIIARTTLVELYNHRPKYLDRVLRTIRAELDAVVRRGALLDDAGFKAILDKAMVERYKPQERWQAREIIRRISEN